MSHPRAEQVVSSSGRRILVYNRKRGVAVEQKKKTPGAIARFFQRLFSPTVDLAPSDEDIPEQNPPPVTGMSPSSPGSIERMLGMSGDGRFQEDVEDRARVAAYKDYDAMALEMPEFSRSLSIVAEAVTSNNRGDLTFILRFKPGVDEQVITLLRDTVERLKLRDKVKPAIQSGEKYGDTFSELVVDGDQIVEVAPRSPYTMVRVHDIHGRLVKFVQKITASGGTGGIEFAPGQIVHMRANHQWGHRYGSSMGESGRFIYRKLAMCDDAMVANRLTRAVQRYAMLQDVQGLSTDEALEFIDDIEFRNSRESLIDENGRLDLRAKVMSDQENIVMGVRTPGVGDVRVLEGSHNVDKIEDIKFLRHRFVVMLPPPNAYLGIEEDVNSKATLMHEAIEYAKYIRSTQDDTAGPWVKKILMRQAALSGYLLEPNDFKVVFAPPSILDEEVQAGVLKVQAEAAKIFNVDIGLPLDFVIDHVLRLPDDAADELKTMLGDDASAGAMSLARSERRAQGSEVFDVLRSRADVRSLIDGLGVLIHELSSDQRAAQR